MKDLTDGSIARNILQMAVPIAAGMFFQTLYFLIDLYFVAGLGGAAIAGVGAAGNVMFIVFSLTQVLGVGTVALISQAVGRRDRADATLIFNQSLVLSASCALITLVFGYGLGHAYVQTLGSDAATVLAGSTYLNWFLPSLALQFALVAMGSALRGTGIVQPTMIVQVATVVLNAVLAPVLIAGWGTGHPLGVAGAGLASSLSVGVGVVLLGLYFRRLEKYVAFECDAQWRPQLAVWGRLLRVGLPAGGEFALMFIYMAVIYWIIRRFGADAQAGFGIGQRIMQSMFLPAMAVAFATAPIVGQNFGAGQLRARARNFWTRRVDRHLHHGRPDAILPMGGGVGRSRVHGSTGCGGRRHAVPAGDFLEFRRQRSGVHLLGGISRLGQYGAGGVEFGEPHRQLRRAGIVARVAAAVSADPAMVCVDRERHAAGVPQSVAGAGGVSRAPGRARATGHQPGTAGRVPRDTQNFRRCIRLGGAC